MFRCAPPVGVLVSALLISAGADQGEPRPPQDFERLPYAPRGAVVHRAPGPLTIDGRLDEPGWRAAAWSEPFVDIEGDLRPPPRFLTRMKMLWDERFFYIAADMEEPHLWATLTERDAVIFHDNDFEVFIDPDGDTHAYYELEVNAFGTAWDLMLLQPYRDGGSAIDAWDIAGLQVGVDLRGTINDPRDVDDGWTVELALPWGVLAEAAPGGKPPAGGDRWRVNFSRVQWHLDVKDGGYAKRLDPRSGKPLPEDNWVWSPQGAVNMHMPERWGTVSFSGAEAGAGAVGMPEDPNERVKWALRRLYYRQRSFRTTHGRYADALPLLNADEIQVEGLEFRPSMRLTDSLYEITAPGFLGATVHLREDGKVWLTGAKK